jgi:hypothetical protein
MCAQHKVMEEEALATSGQASKARLRLEKRSRARNWDVAEMLSLAHAKRAEWEKYEQVTVRERAEMSAQQKWDAIGQYMQEHGFPERDGRGCKVKWENLLSDFKGVKDWENRSGNEGPAYWAMSSNERQAEGLPRQFAQELFDVLDNLYSTRQLPEDEFPESPTSTGLNTGLDNVGSGDRELGSSHRKRKGVFANGVEKSIRETRDTCVAGIERERALIGKERMEDDRADRRALIGVLATLASACDKIATKLN